ncbi:MAG: oligosaccharide flippase family protein [Candidatus Sulfotelmatobacter sp.]
MAFYRGAFNLARRNPLDLWMRGYLRSSLRWLRLAFRNGQVADHAQGRDVRILQGIFSGLAGRGVATVVSFVSVPLTVRYLGPERYGAWVTISTLMAWMALADLGLNNSLTNAVSDGYAKDRRDLAQSYVSAAFWSLTGIAVVLALIFFSVWPMVPWDHVFNVHSEQARKEIGPSVAVAFAIFVLNFPVSIVAKIYGAYQEVPKGNAWSATANLLSLAALVTVTKLRGGLVFLVIAVSGSLLLVNAASAVWLFGWAKPWLFPHPSRVTWSAVQKLLSFGGLFFLIQMSALVLFQTDNLIIAHYMGAAAVTPYSVTWRLFSYASIFQVLAGSSFWPAYAEAFSRGDGEWVRRRFRMNLRISLVSTLALALPFVAFGKWIIQEWAGSAAVPSAGLLLWMGVWSLIFSAMSAQSCLLAASGRIKGQTIYSIAASVVNLVLSIVLIQRVGLVGVIMGTVGAFAICVIVPQSFEVQRSTDHRVK